jgi:hypothetical protein
LNLPYRNFYAPFEGFLAEEALEYYGAVFLEEV